MLWEGLSTAHSKRKRDCIQACVECSQVLYNREKACGSVSMDGFFNAEVQEVEVYLGRARRNDQA